MEFNWKALLIFTILCGSINIIMITSNLPNTNLEEDVEDTKSNSKNMEKQEENEDAGLTKEISVNLPRRDDTSETKPRKKDKKNTRPKRSVVNTTTETGRKVGGEESDDVVVMKERLATAELTKHLRTLPVSQERTVPLVKTEGRAYVPLYVSIKVLTVFEINDVKQTIKTGLYISLSWRDKALAWNTSLYEKMAEINIPRSIIWTPQIFVPNSRDLHNILNKIQFISVNYDGNVTAHIAILLETACSMDLSWYPFDEQTCMIKFLSTSSAPMLWIVEENASDKNLSRSLALNSEWELMNVSTKLYLQSGENPNPEVRVRLRRKTRFYSVCLILPMVVTSYMNTLVFLVPLQSGEKISFLVSLYVSTSVFTSFFSTTMPRGLDTIPVSMKLLTGVIVESLLVLLATLLVLRAFHTEQEASAVSSSSPEKDSSEDDDPAKQLESNKLPPLQPTTDLHPQSLQDPPQSRGVATAWMSPRPSSVTPRDHAVRASRATRFCGLRELTAGQLDRILFVIFLAANSIFLLALLTDVLKSTYV